MTAPAHSLAARSAAPRDLRIEQDQADAEYARRVVHRYRIEQRIDRAFDCGVTAMSIAAIAVAMWALFQPFPA